MITSFWIQHGIIEIGTGNDNYSRSGHWSCKNSKTWRSKLDNVEMLSQQGLVSQERQRDTTVTGGFWRC